MGPPMTTPKEALERAREALCSHFGPGRYRVNFPYIDEALASLQGEDAVERVAQAVTTELEKMYKDGVPMCMREGETTWRTYYAGFDLSMFSNRIVDAILATGCVPGEAAIRADERERCAKVADEHLFGREIDWWLNATKKDVAAETCRSIAAAIRSGGAK